MYRKVLRQMARDRGKRVIGVKWVDINKGDDRQPNYPPRLVAKELKAFNPYTPQEELHAATPPTGAQTGGALRTLLLGRQEGVLLLEGHRGGLCRAP